MTNNAWNTPEIGSLCYGIFDGPHATPVKTSAGPVFLGISNLNRGRLDLAETEHLSEDDFKKWTRRVTPQPNDVVFSYETRLGEVAIIPTGLRCCLGRRMALMRPDPEKVEPHFLLYAFLGPDFQDTIRKHTIPGSTVDRIPLIEFPQFPIRVPSLPEQRAIAHVLGTLDDKIDLNRRTNETLEAMARAIFKSWFVDFDPVHAKAEGRQPYGMDAATAALFPNSFDASALGKIPSGWKVDEIRTRTSNIQYGLTRSAATDPVGPRFLRITDIQGGRVDWSRVPFCPVSDEEHQKYRICPGDILVARTGASTGENIYIIDAPDAVFASYLVRIQFADPSFARMVGEYMRSVAYFDHVAGAIGGSAQPNASAQVLASAPLTFPPIAVARSFLQLVDPLDSQRLLNSRQNQTLISTRDALLPKLLSGEIRIRNADNLIEAST
jgi:type I restriction enzyme S subunit